MLEKSSKGSDKFDWFWSLTTKWWFFITFYVFLVVLYIILFFIISEGKYMDIDPRKNVLLFFILTIYLMPNGILYFLSIPASLAGDYSHFFVYFPIFFHLSAIISVISIHSNKTKKNKILKWLILMLILLMILSFGGCMANINIH